MAEGEQSAGVAGGEGFRECIPPVAFYRWTVRTQQILEKIKANIGSLQKSIQDRKVIALSTIGTSLATQAI